MDSDRSVDIQTVKETLVKLLAIADRMDARNLQTVQRIEQAAVALDQGINRLDGGGERFATTALSIIHNEARDSIEQGAKQALDAFEQRLLNSAGIAGSAAQAMDMQRKSLTTARRTLVWNALAALLVGSLIAAGGAAWTAHRTMQEMAQAHFERDILQATQNGSITRCGDSLCTRVGKKPQRYGNNADYVFLQQ
jgi:hypothetical protein